MDRTTGEVMTDNYIETITHGLEPIALIIRAEFDEPGIHFFTPPSFSQQVAFMKHTKGKKIAPHVHNLVNRQVLYTQEVLLIRRGRLRINLYSSDRKFLEYRILEAGDVILLCGGGHSFEMLEETSMIEVKQGPYAGEKDKTRFEEDPSCR
jgi:mannose-6-phosphate isomerase-like protein (cupin superfamily)